MQEHTGVPVIVTQHEDGAPLGHKGLKDVNLELVAIKDASRHSW